MKDFKYKCTVLKNGDKRYYKKTGGKWKRISNKLGMENEKDKRKYMAKKLIKLKKNTSKTPINKNINKNINKSYDSDYCDTVMSDTQMSDIQLNNYENFDKSDTQMSIDTINQSATEIFPSTVGKWISKVSIENVSSDDIIQQAGTCWILCWFIYFFIINTI